MKAGFERPFLSHKRIIGNSQPVFYEIYVDLELDLAENSWLLSAARYHGDFRGGCYVKERGYAADLTRWQLHEFCRANHAFARNQ